MTASNTKSKGQALKVSLVKPVAYLSKGYAAVLIPSTQVQPW
jgi:hypothetical protein